MKRVIGIDPGTVMTGYGIIEGDEYEQKMVTSGCIKPPGKIFLHDRLAFLYDHICQIIKDYNPSEMAIEEVFFSKNARTALVLGHARGVILLAGVHLNLKCYEYSPRKIKMSVVGHGAASKEQVQFMVKSILGLSQTPMKLDETDALATALCHMNQTKLV